MYEVSEAIDNKIELHVKNKIEEELTKMKNKAISNSNKGYLFEGCLFAHYHNTEQLLWQDYQPFIEIEIISYISEMTEEYFNNGLFKKMIEIQYKPKADIISLFVFSHDEQINEINSTNNGYSLYYDLDGNYLGDKESDLIKKQVKVPVIDVVETDNNQNDDSKNKEEIQIVSPYS